MSICLYQSPIGVLKISDTDGKITGLCLCNETDGDGLAESPSELQRIVWDGGNQTSCTPLLRDACRQLDEYFQGSRRDFDLPLGFAGTPFQESVWRALRTIPYGETRSYGDIAARVGNPRAVRAVGQANNKNPIMIFVPCHRVIHKNGSIGGFACGVEVKRYLLDLEIGDALGQGIRRCPGQNFRG